MHPRTVLFTVIIIAIGQCNDVRAARVKRQFGFPFNNYYGNIYNQNANAQHQINSFIASGQQAINQHLQNMFRPPHFPYGHLPNFYQPHHNHNHHHDQSDSHEEEPPVIWDDSEKATSSNEPYEVYKYVKGFPVILLKKQDIRK